MNFEKSCLHCDRTFAGRPNKLYCSHSCKREEERAKDRLEKLHARMERLKTAEKEAMENQDWFEKRMVMADKRNAAREIEEIQNRLQTARKPPELVSTVSDSRNNGTQNSAPLEAATTSP